MKKIELLAPAGNMGCLKAAIQAGSDAVYLAGYMFGARSFAGNFSDEELIAAIKYAHLYGVKIYVTVNTIIYENEVNMFINYIDFLHKNNVDAIIIQDLGMLDLIRKTFPNLEIHASTQMHIHNKEGVMFAKKHGIKRVVIAREVDVEEIKKIKEIIDVELEVFSHGALCVSYSGQCLMSSLIGNRSGNRGTCTQCCRKPYELFVKENNELVKINNDKYLLSMKDLNTLEHIDQLIDAKVDSIKIEGRMKSKEYVYQVVKLYRQAIDSYLNNNVLEIKDEDIKDLKKIFNREFTKGFLFNEQNENIVNQYRPNHQGICIGEVIKVNGEKIDIRLSDNVSQGDGIRILSSKGDVGGILNYIYLKNKLVNKAFDKEVISIAIKGNIEIGDKVLKTTDFLLNKNIEQQISKNSRKVLISGSVKAKKGDKLKFTITDSINNVTVESDFKVEQATNNPTSIERIVEQFSKLGNTIYKLDNLDTDFDIDIFVNIKEINELRRKAIATLDQLREYKINYTKEEYSIEVRDFEKEENLNVLVNSSNQYDQIKGMDIRKIYVQSKKIFEKIKDDKRVILKMPRVIKKHDNLDQLLLIGEVGSINKYSTFHTDFSFNVTNSYAVAFLHSLGAEKITLSQELTFSQIKDIIDAYHNRYKKHPNLEVIINDKPEAMIMKFNLLNYYKISNKEVYIKDEFNNLYPIKNTEGEMVIYNYEDINLSNRKRYYNIGINNLRINCYDDNSILKIKDNN